MTVGRGGTFVNVFLIFIVWDLNYFWRMGEKAGMCSNIISEFKKEKNNFFPFFFKDARGSVYAIDLQFSATSGGEGYVGSSDVAAAAHRGVLQYICSDAHKLAVWLSPDFFVNKNAYHHAVCASPAHEHLSYIKAGHKRALCSPCILPIMLTLNGEPLWCPHTVTPHDPDPPHTHTVCWAAMSSRVSVMPCELTFEILPQLPSSIWLCSVTHHHEPSGVSWLGCDPEWVMSFDWLAAWVD